MTHILYLNIFSKGNEFSINNNMALNHIIHCIIKTIYNIMRISYTDVTEIVYFFDIYKIYDCSYYIQGNYMG